MSRRVSVLGTFTVTVDGHEIAAEDWTLRSRQLVALLAMTPDHRLHREQVVDRLWPHLAPDAGAANLHKAAHLVRRATGDPDTVVLSGGTVRLWPGRDDVGVDLVEFEHLASRAINGDDPSGAAVALDAYQGDLLTEDPYEEWVIERQRDLVALRERLGDVMSGEADAGTSPSVPLTGRVVELARLRAAARHAWNGSTTAVLLRGPAGIGKSALLRRVVDDAVHSGWTVWSGRAGTTMPDVPFGPLLTGFGELLVDESAPLAPDDRAVLRRIIGHPDGDGHVLLGRHAVLGTVHRAARACARRSGLCIAIDEAGTLDRATVGVLRELALDHDLRLLVVLAHRAAADQPTKDLSAALLADGASAVDLGPLSDDEAMALVGSGTEPPLDAAARRHVVERAGGNPSTLRILARSGDPDTGVTPASVAAQITARLAADDHDLTAALHVCAIADNLTAAELIAVVGDGPTTDRLLATGVLEAVDGRFVWRESVVREAVGASIAPIEALDFHGLAAARLVTVDARPLVIAEHLLAANRNGDALPYLTAAADAAMAVAAWADALEIVDRALTCDPGDPGLLDRRARLTFLTGDPAAALAYGKAAAAAPDEVTRDRLHYGQAWAWLSVGDLAAAQQALHAVGRSEPGDAHGATVEAMVACFAGRLDDAEALASTARRLAEADGDTRSILDATFTGGMVAHARGSFAEVLSRELLQSSGLEAVAGIIHDGYLCPAQSWLFSGEPVTEIARFALRLRDAAAAGGAVRGEAFATLLAGQALLLSGECTDAAALLQDARELHVAVDAPAGEALSILTLAQLATSTDRSGSVGTLVAAAADATRRSPLNTWHLLPRIHGTTLAAGGEVGAAIARGAAELRGPEDACPSCWLTFAIPAGQALAKAGSIDDARSFVDRAEAIISARWNRGGWVAALAETRGLIGEDPDAARTFFTEAADEFDRCGQRLDARRCREAIAEVR